MLLLDLKSAFDAVDHTIPLNKLDIYGFIMSGLDLFHSTLSPRILYTTINNELSNKGSNKCGMPQISILGHLAFDFIHE